MDINKYNMFCHCERSEAIAKSLGLLRFALYETLRERNDILDLIMTIYLVTYCVFRTLDYGTPEANFQDCPQNYE